MDEIRPSGRRKRFLACLFVLGSIGGLQQSTMLAQTDAPPNPVNQLRLETGAVSPQRFIAAHGRRALISGYAGSGLEVWAYPLQLVDGYRISFRTLGASSEINGTTLLRRIAYEPDAIVRTYIGADFVVQERLFVPLDESAAVISYTLQSRQPLHIVVHFNPILNLMWPASIGGQSVKWDGHASAYVLSEPTHQFSGFIGSPEIVEHDEVFNSAQPGIAQNGLAFTIRATPAHTITVLLGLSVGKQADPAAYLGQLVGFLPSFLEDSRKHYQALAAHSMQVRTPNEAVNETLAWAEVALDQAWVCNRDLGCGLVAGYGPSRNSRRPQYAWFFAGDALIAIDALVDTGAYDRAKDSLRFIRKYQDTKTGMIWHELSQSAGLLDWANKYPYMYAHVDITFGYLQTVRHYVSATGDTQFANDSWVSLLSAYNYCRSLLNSQDSLPRIPATKEGGNEQDRRGDESALSSAWVTASTAFAELADRTGHRAEAEQARRLSEKARLSAAARYWDDQRNFWIDGYSDSNQPIYSPSIHGSGLVTNHILDRNQEDAALDKIASSEFQTDWGTRSTSSAAPDFDPNSYAKGSVWAAGSAGIASTFWAVHRPFTAFPLWNALIAWSSLDSLGHMHEVLAGDFYHEQVESVPEQTWSSAALLSATVHGLLGLEVDGASRRLSFSPHLPAQWNTISVENIKLAQGSVSMSLFRKQQGLELKIQNTGTPITLLFAPEIPLGARVTGATVDDRPVPLERESRDQDTHAKVTLGLPTGETRCLIEFEGGVMLATAAATLLPGEPSRALKIIDVSYRNPRLMLRADVDKSHDNAIQLATTWKIVSVEGATLRSLGSDSYDLVIERLPPNQAAPGSYHRVEIAISLAEGR